MRPHRLVGIALLIVAFEGGWGPALAGDSPAETALKAKGLTRAGRVFVDAEAEKPVLAKMKEVRATSFAAFATAADKQAAAEQLQMQSAQLDEQRATLQANLNALTQQINAENASMGGRYRRMAGSMTAPLRAQQQQVQAAMNETNNMQKVTKSQIPSAKDKAAIDADVKKKGEVFKSDLTELRTKIDEVTKRYDELNADEKVKKTLAELEKAGHAKMTIGPSEAFAAGMKEIDQAERRFLGKKATAPAKKKSVAKDKAKK
jgi:hypothetical protein